MPISEDPLANMQARAEQCRRLADLTHDRSMVDQLRQWAVEIEADIRRLEQQRAEKGQANGALPVEPRQRG